MTIENALLFIVACAACLFSAWVIVDATSKWQPKDGKR
jgi:hypothetical protein